MKRIDFLHLSAHRTPGKAALVCGDRRLTYRELDAMANQCAHALADAGLARGSRIAVFSSNCVEYAIVHYAIARAGHVAVHISLKVTADDLVFMLNKAGVSLVFAHRQHAAVANRIRPSVPTLRLVISVGGGQAPQPGGKEADADFWQFIAGQLESFPDVAVDEDDPGALNFTGGTTGFPKAVLTTHRARTATVHTALTYFGLNDRDVVCVATPLFHAAGLFVVFAPAIALGTTVILLEAWEPPLFMEATERHGITATLLVPSQLNELIRHEQFAPSRLGSLRKVGYAGSPMTSTLFESLRTALPEVALTENYGQTETGPMAVRGPWHPAGKLRTVGQPALGVEIRIVDAAGSTLPRGEVGEVLTRGPHVLAGYFDEPAQTAAAFRGNDGWLWTGDLGFLDEDGYLTIVDRSKDMLISGGENIYPAEIENVLCRHEAVAECAVFGIPDERWGEVPAAHVVLKKGSSVSQEELIAHCATLIAKHKRPRRIEFVGGLPRTPMGKVQKSVLRDNYWKGRERKI